LTDANLVKARKMATLRNSVELLEQAIALASKNGIVVRVEVLDGLEGGYCRLGQREFVFLDPSLTAAEQLEVILPVLQNR
jgi:hypothetical protein